MWSEFKREVNRQPYNILASLKAKLSEVMADKDRDVVIHSCNPARSSGLGLRLLLRQVGISLNKCVCNMYINFF
jgi:hypothetical protein